jgi:hypothetical protein
MNVKQFRVCEEFVRNSLGMAIVIFAIKGDDDLTYAETRYSDIACHICNCLNERLESVREAEVN